MVVVCGSWGLRACGGGRGEGRGAPCFAENGEAQD